MSRFVHIVGQEIRLAARDRVLLCILVGFAAIAFYGAWIGAQWQVERAATTAAISAEIGEMMENKREQFAKAKPGEIPFAAMPQVTPFRPVLEPGALGPLSIGQAEAYPYAARMLPLGDETMFDAFRVHVDNPASKAAGHFDLALVIVYLMPLLLIAATYDFWVRARERGVLGLTLSQPVSPSAILAAKALSRTVLVLLPMVLIVGCALATSAGLHLAGIGAAMLTVFTYALFWMALIVLVNVVVRKSTEAAVACGVLWLLVVALVPAVSLAFVDLTRPAPSAITRTNEIRAMYLQHRAEIRERPPLEERDPAPRIPDRLRVFMADILELETRKAPILERYEAALTERREALEAMRFILPSIAAQDALDRIAGSDAGRAVSFQQQVLAFRGETRRWLAERFAADAPMTLADYQTVPKFKFREPDQRGALAVNWLLLAAAAVALSAVAFAAVRRRHPLES